jgi:undecaprenyl-diphosphatase
MGALALGIDRRTAAEFSFFLAIPTLGGAFAYDLYKNRDAISLDQAGIIGLGFVVSFVSGLVVIRYMLGFIARRGLTPFGWWRIVVGGVGLVLLG